ncbi:MAG: hypothetical protein BM557_06055 [Flavobacterium sp. MedPE-SWcel]|uniref:serine hydrolase domain-containing protein n=1 Tax=uncultured Flavobacterium sp. TaxID=165435 RepID=UPI00090F8A89|nr:serine hydrolase domain-containing protein [uncultured Flavobacterium sp.]OIQ19264.1 MAG: hypothetical protein BM557_06055 [Flavobacterium sp. MedPE-SWcel]
MKKSIKYLFALTILVLAGCSNDDDKTTKEPVKDNEGKIVVLDSETLSLRLNQIIEASNFPGITVGIVKNGEQSYQDSFGYMDIAGNKPYTNQTVQSIGSISKTFIAAALVKTIELDHFTLETPINDILDQPIVNPNNNDVIRIKHLVTHTSGIIDQEEVYLSSYYILEGENLNGDGVQMLQAAGVEQRQPKTLQEFIQAYFYEGGDYYSTENFMNNTPGTVQEYSNTASTLAAYLIEKATATPYEDFVKQHILTPLQMNSTAYHYNELQADKIATLYFNKNTPLPKYNLETFPDGALKTSNEDMMKYLLNMMAGYRGNSTTLFSQDSYNLVFNQITPTYSVFWDRDNNHNVGHTGGDPGLSTEIYFNGNDNSGFFIISNYDASSHDSHESHYIEITNQIEAAITDYLKL